MDELILQNQNLNKEIQKLKEENIQLYQLITELKDHLKKYTAPKRSKFIFDRFRFILLKYIKFYYKRYNKRYKSKNV
jgi:hypothetical protein